MVRWDVDAFIQQVQNKQLLPESIIKELCEKTKEVLVQEGNVRLVSAPVTLVGDVHGQFFDVLEIFRIGGFCPNTNYVFLGDYVDRGYYSVETITLLTCLKLRYPDRVTLVRGNHESRAVTQTYGFYAECQRKYGNSNVWTYFTDMFDYLVLSVIIDDAIFCVHGGLSPSLHTIDQIRVIDRFREIPHDGPMADLVWSDPISQPVGGLGQLPVPGATLADDNKGDFMVSPRGAGYMFGKEVTRKFLEVNGLGHICRAHQLCHEGYQILFDDMLSTVWSAPNYCYRAGNMASVLEIGPGLERFFNVFGPCPEQERDIAAFAVAAGGTPPVGNNPRDVAMMMMMENMDMALGEVDYLDMLVAGNGDSAGAVGSGGVVNGTGLGGVLNGNGNGAGQGSQGSERGRKRRFGGRGGLRGGMAQGNFASAGTGMVLKGNAVVEVMDNMVAPVRNMTKVVDEYFM